MNRSQLGMWLRDQRRSHGWDQRTMAIQLIKAAEANGDQAMPGLASLQHNVYRWEAGSHEPSERYKLHYCRAFGIVFRRFGVADEHSSFVR